MIDFIKDVWLWILIPFVLLLLGIGAVLLLSGGTDGSSPFIYNVF